ncbi:glucan biosynthesis protein [Phenylobacterium sp.]|uniref:glucan biosynthesis protein n=1 Tax=Phenylobacterium sp. TaxID=1871053 RepID=UPI00301E5F74
MSDCTAATRSLRRRDVVALAPAALMAAAWAPAGVAADTVRERARRLAAEPYRPPASPLPPALAALGYDAYRDLRYRPDHAIWSRERLPFQLQMFHRGGLFRDPVELFEVHGATAQAIPYRAEQFSYGPQDPGPLPPDLGFAGFRIHAPLDVRGRFDEVAAFLGASYFRAVARGVGYGLSARGLTLGAGEPGEEFPAFRAFWIERPARGARRIVVHALLDSPSVAGAYRFEIGSGAATVMEIEASLFPRRPLASAGLAPLTSMYLFGPEQPRRYDDFRPQVHDSDGLLTADGRGPPVWRPLVHTPATRIRDLDPGPPRAFGLLQRQRDFAAYQDLEALYHQRPGAWVEPLEGFPPGAVRLVELGARSEAEDNVVTMWRPAQPLAAGREHRFRYRLTWAAQPEPPSRLARAVAWRSGHGHTPRERRFIVEFGPGASDELSAQVSASAGAARLETVQPNAQTGGARVSFAFNPGTAVASDLRVGLVRGGAPVSEAWLYRWIA